jgi:3D (Asp-Asp-Asp) domain-containing protein
MTSGPRHLRVGPAPAALLVATVALLVTPVDALASGGVGLGGSTSVSARSVSTLGTGGAPIGGVDPRPVPKPKPKAKPKAKKKGAQKAPRGVWLHGVAITEYWPAPEAWFVGRLVSAPGLSGKHRIDWLYSATGVSMEGEGFGLDGRMYHIDALGNEGWVTASGAPTHASDGFAAGAPYWRAGGYWKNSHGAVTFPLSAGGWSAGTGRHYAPIPGVTFAAGPSLPLRFYQSIAVDPRVIPLGSRVYIPAYKHDGHGGWFTAQDTGGAINGRHVDVYRRPPASPNDSGQYLTGQKIFVEK